MAHTEENRSDLPSFTKTEKRYLIGLGNGLKCGDVAGIYNVAPHSVQNALTDMLARIGQTGNSFLFPLVFALRTKEIFPSEILPQGLDVAITLQAVRDNGLANTVKEILGSPEDGVMLRTLGPMNQHKRKLRLLREILGATSSAHAIGMCEAMRLIAPGVLDTPPRENSEESPDEYNRVLLSEWNSEGLGAEVLFGILDDPDACVLMTFATKMGPNGHMYGNPKIIAIAPNSQALLQLVLENSGDKLSGVIREVLHSEERVIRVGDRRANMPNYHVTAFSTSTIPVIAARALHDHVKSSFTLGEKERRRMLAFLTDASERSA